MQNGKMVCKQVERIPANRFLALILRIDAASPLLCRRKFVVEVLQCGDPGIRVLFKCRQWTF